MGLTRAAANIVSFASLPGARLRAGRAAEARSVGSEASLAPRIVRRQIGEDDLDAAVAFLARSFPERSLAYWRRAFLRLRERAVPDGCPRYGTMLMAGREVVGLVLLIYARTDEGRLRANISSWAVAPDYRAYSNLLLAAAFKAGDVTFVNVSPSPFTLETIVAQGFSRYVGGTVHALALLGRPVRGARVRLVEAGTPSTSPLLAEHAACGCICLEVIYCGVVYPFVFVASRSIAGRLPSAQLVYCRDIAELVRFAGPLGRRLARLGLATILVDAVGPIRGLVGRFAPGRRVKYYRGPAPPRLGDLSATELVYLGP